jgi:hypothetical protein
VGVVDGGAMPPEVSRPRSLTPRGGTSPWDGSDFMMDDDG